MKSSLIWIAVLVTSVMTLGCVGQIETGPAPATDAGNPTPDASSGTPPPPSETPDARTEPGTPDAAPLPDAGADFFTCREPVTADLPSGRHNAGQNCMQCHSAAGPGPRWYAAGTVFTNGGGSTPLRGATITIQDATGKVIDLVTAENGNFWTPEPLEYPLYTFASRCPDLKSMGPEVPANALGACNSCHGSSVARISL